MIFDLAFIGFGVITTQTLSELLSKKIKKKINIAIIEKDLRNFPGGIAYSQEKSKFGYFNNPLRLSNKEFFFWIKKKKNLENLKEFINKNKDYDLINWLEYNKKNLDKREFSEIYLPRLTYSFFLNDKISKILSQKDKNIEIKVFNGEAVKIEKKHNYLIKTKSKLSYCKYFFEKGNVKLKKKKKLFIESVKTKRIILGLGVLPPKEIALKNNTNKNYIWDFYNEGGTKNLIKKIKNIKKKKILILFIGNKAGLLEPMKRIEYLINNGKKNIKIISIAPNLISLEKATLTKDHKKLKLKYFNIKRINKLNTALKIFKFLTKEFENVKKTKFNKYDVWTKILKGNFLNVAYNQLSKKEKNIYDLKVLDQIRNITRFTYPATVIAKQSLQKKKKLKLVKGRIKSIIATKKLMTAIFSNNKKIKADIIANVSGPRKITDKGISPSIIDSLKSCCYKYNEKGFYANKDFLIGENIFSPGTLSLNFNPLRQTIIKSISLNCIKSARKIYSDIHRL